MYVCMYTCLRISLSACLSGCLSVCLSVYMSMFLYKPVCVYRFKCIRVSVVDTKSRLKFTPGHALSFQLFGYDFMVTHDAQVVRGICIRFHRQ